MTKALRETYQFKITLKDSKPPIWRRFLIDNSTTLPDLHQVLQFVMGWTDSHLHQFIAGDTFYGILDPDFGMDFNIVDESNYRISQLLNLEKDSILYEYDFGDGWQHLLTLEKILPFDPKQPLPFCVKVKGACPPEDVGGIWGYYDFLEAIIDPNHPEFEGYREWIGGDFKPDVCDIDEINQLLGDYCS